jgi:hypothetical protein
VAYRITDGGICKNADIMANVQVLRGGERLFGYRRKRFRENLERQYERRGLRRYMPDARNGWSIRLVTSRGIWGMTNFLLRGREGTQAEISIVATRLTLYG